VAEAHGGDRLSFYMEEMGDLEYCVRIVKTDSASGEEIETCRSKIVFR
jgi:hypothetical protein